MKKNSLGNMRKKERKQFVITLAMMKKNRLEKLTKKERLTNIYKLQMKETVFLIISKCVACLIHQYSQHQLSD